MKQDKTQEGKQLWERRVKERKESLEGARWGLNSNSEAEGYWTGLRCWPPWYLSRGLLMFLHANRQVLAWILRLLAGRNVKPWGKHVAQYAVHGVQYAILLDGNTNHRMTMTRKMGTKDNLTWVTNIFISPRWIPRSSSHHLDGEWLGMIPIGPVSIVFLAMW